MKINYNKWHAKLIRFVWFKNERTMPKSLCSYFWLIVFGCIWFIPTLIMSIPYYIGKLLPSGIGTKGIGRYIDSIYTLGLCIFAMLGFVGMIVGSQISAISFYFGFKADKDFTMAGIFVQGVAFILIIAYKIDRLKRSRAGTKVDKPNLVKEFIKAKWNKVCPRIEYIK